MSAYCAVPGKDCISVDASSNLKALARPEAKIETTHLDTRDFMQALNSANSGADAEMINVIRKATIALNDFSHKEQASVLNVFNAMLAKCAATDLLDDAGNMLSPNASVSSRQEAITRALARAIAGMETREQVVAAMGELSELLCAGPGRNAPRDLLAQRARVAFHALYEIGTDDKARVHQKNDVTCVLTVANKDLARETPADYLKTLRQWTLQGVAEFYSAGELIQIAYESGALNQGLLKGRTLGCALYQNTVANHYGIKQTGMLPHIAENYYDDLLGGVRLLTPTTDVCANTNTSSEILSAATKSDWVGVSVQWADPGEKHSYHFVRLRGLVEIDGKKYVRLENPWSSDDNQKLPAGVLAASRLIGGEGNELLMEEGEFKKRIYFALIKTGAADRGETAGLNKGNTTISYLSETFYFDIIKRFLEQNKTKKSDQQSEIEADTRLRGETKGQKIKPVRALEIEQGENKRNYVE